MTRGRSDLGLLDDKVAVITGAGSGMAKADVVSLTWSASAEYGRKGVRVNCICPRFIETEIMGAAGGSNFPEIAKKASLARGGRPEEVAQVAAFLCSDRAS